MAKIHDLFIVELAEVIKGYGNDPDVEDPFRLSEFYRFYELPNIAVSRENFENMRPIEERKKGKWIAKEDRPKQEVFICSECGGWAYSPWIGSRKNPKPNRCKYNYCPNCGADMRG